MKKLITGVAIALIGIVSYAAGCCCSNKPTEVPQPQPPQMVALATNAVPVVPCQCKCSCACCCKCEPGCKCDCCYKCNVQPTVTTNIVAVKEYKCGNRFFGASVTVTRDTPTTVIHQEWSTFVAPPPPPPRPTLWLWTPGYYETSVIFW